MKWLKRQLVEKIQGNFNNGAEGNNKMENIKDRCGSHGR